MPPILPDGTGGYFPFGTDTGLNPGEKTYLSDKSNVIVYNLERMGMNVSEIGVDYVMTPIEKAIEEAEEISRNKGASYFSLGYEFNADATMKMRIPLDDVLKKGQIASRAQALLESLGWDTEIPEHQKHYGTATKAAKLFIIGRHLQNHQVTLKAVMQIYS